MPCHTELNAFDLLGFGGDMGLDRVWAGKSLTANLWRFLAGCGVSDLAKHPVNIGEILRGVSGSSPFLVDLHS